MCCCEKNCCWNGCRLTNPPEDCLQGIDAFWMKDPRNKIWVAQEHLKNEMIVATNVSSTNNSYPTELDVMENTTGTYIS